MPFYKYYSPQKEYKPKRIQNSLPVQTQRENYLQPEFRVLLLISDNGQNKSDRLFAVDRL